MIKKGSYGLFVKSRLGFEESCEKVRESCKKEGFGILWEIDVKKTMKEKLGVDFPNYIIFGACNPPIAHQALTLEPDLGLLLPCNFIAREENGEVIIGGISPQSLLSLTKREDMTEMASVVYKKIEDLLMAFN